MGLAHGIDARSGWKFDLAPYFYYTGGVKALEAFGGCGSSDFG
jgi:hypothetical protein